MERLTEAVRENLSLASDDPEQFAQHLEPEQREEATIVGCTCVASVMALTGEKEAAA